MGRTVRLKTSFKRKEKSKAFRPTSFALNSRAWSSLAESRMLTPTPDPKSVAFFLVSDLLPNTMHLGRPMIFSHRDRNKAYDFIVNKFWAKLTTAKANKLNHAGRLTYIKSVLASIHVYYMSTVLSSLRPSWRKSTLSFVGYGGLVSRRTIPQILLLSVPGKTFANLRGTAG